MTKQDLIKLREDIILNSLYTNDYDNTFNIPPQQVQDFFDSYLENCEYILDDNDDLNLPYDEYYNTLFKIANNYEYLWEFYNTFEEDPLLQEYYEKYYKE